MIYLVQAFLLTRKIYYNPTKYDLYLPEYVLVQNCQEVFPSEVATAFLMPSSICIFLQDLETASCIFVFLNILIEY